MLFDEYAEQTHIGKLAIILPDCVCIAVLRTTFLHSTAYLMLQEANSLKDSIKFI